MAVTNYTPGASMCKYTYSKLKDVIYLVSKDHLKNVYIDNGEAYIDGLTELPLRLNGFNISLNEETSLDERYKFTKSVTLSMHGYVDSSVFGGRYYVILESFDGTFWMVNVDFPSRLTYTFNLAKNTYQTDFTLSSVSNFPTLRLASDFESEEAPCLGFNIYGVDSLKLLEKELCGIDAANKTVYTYTEKPFQDVKFLGDSCSMQEVFDGEHVSTTIEFNISFDAYKSSWHYNLLEFLENLYSAIITPKGGDNAFFAGFNFGLEPSFVVQTQSNQGESDIITVRLIEASNHGSTAAVDWDEEQTTDTKWAYVRWVDTIKCYECIELGHARYLVQQEVKKNGVPTGNYKVLEGYVSYYQSLGLNVVGTFSNEEIFNDPDCTGEQCSVASTLPTTIIYHEPTCYTYSYSAACDWMVTDLASYMSVTPSTGQAGADYSLVVCNSKTPTGTETSTFMIKAGTNRKIVNVILTNESGILIPQTAYINCLEQNVTFVYDANCPITVTSIDPRLTYQITNSQLIVHVPRNYSIVSGITWDITVKDCNNATETAHIVQDKTYERWVDTGDYLCDSGNSYVKQVRYTGTTSEDANTPTGESRKGGIIQSGDSRCQVAVYRWKFYDKYYCISGNKFEAQEEEVSTDNGATWTKTGNARPGTMVESASSFCEQTVQYKWELTSKWQCDYTPTVLYKLQATYDSGGTTVERNVECDSATTLTTGDTKPEGYAFSSMTNAVIGCVTSIGEYAFSACRSLSSVTIPDSVTSIDTYAFGYCHSFSSFTIPDSVTSIGDNVFTNCSGLRSVTIGSGVTSIGHSTFWNCSGLTEIVIPDSVTSIGNYAFRECISLTSCTIGSGVTSIGSNAFYNCSGLTSITIEATTPPTLTNSSSFNNTTCPIYVPAGSVDTYKSAWSQYADRIQAIP